MKYLCPRDLRRGEMEEYMLKKKQFALFTIVWLCLLSGGVVAKDKEGVAYENTRSRVYKRNVSIAKKITRYVCGFDDGIQKDSRYTVLVHNLSLFESQNVKAGMEQGTLQITQGDGEGALVKGTLAKWNYCVAEVEPKSWFASLFS